MRRMRPGAGAVLVPVEGRRVRRGSAGQVAGGHREARSRGRSGAAPPQPPRPPHRAERDTLDVMVPHMRNPRPTSEDLAPFAEFNRRRAVERAWEREARAAPGSDAIPGAHGAGRRYWVNGRCELAAGGTRGKTMHDAAAMGDARAIARRLDEASTRTKGILSQTPSITRRLKGKRPRSWRYWTAARTPTPATSTDAPLCTARRCPTAAATSDPKRHSPPPSPSSSRISRRPNAVTVPSPPFVDVISSLVTRGARTSTRGTTRDSHLCTPPRRGGTTGARWR